MTLSKSKAEIKSKIVNICKKKKAYFRAPAEFRDLQKDVKQLISYAEATFEAEYVETRKRYAKALPLELRSQASMRKALEKQKSRK